MEDETTPLVASGDVAKYANLGSKENQEKPLPILRCAIFCGLITLVGAVTFTINTTIITQYVHSRFSEQYDVNSTGDTNTTNSTTNDVLTVIQQETSNFMLFLAITTNLPAIFVNVILGSYSDFLGRRIIFFMPLFGLFLRCVFSVCIIYFVMDVNYLYLASVLDGIGGSVTAFFVASFSYAADITSSGRGRIIAVSAIDLCLALAAAMGLLITGYMISLIGYFSLSVMMTSLVLLGCLLILCLPETRKRRSMSNVSMTTLLKKPFRYYFQKSDNDQRMLYNLVLVIFLCMVSIVLGRMGIEQVYALGPPFLFNSIQIGYLGAMRLVFGSIGGIVAIKIFQRCLSDESIALIGSLNCIISLMLEGFAGNSSTLFLVPVVGIVSSTTIAITRGTMSRLASSEDQGAMFAGMALFETVVNMLSQVVFNWVYSSTVGTVKGAVFYLMASISGVSTVLVIVWMYIAPRYRRKYTVCVSEDDDRVSTTNIVDR